MEESAKLVVTAITSGVVSGIGAIVAMKVDQAGMKQSIQDHDRRLTANEDTISRIDQNTQKIAVDVALIRGALNVKDTHGS